MIAVLGASVGLMPARAAGDYILLPRSELMALPKSGPAWDYMIKVARSAWHTPNLQDQNVKNGAQALAAALVYARTGDEDMRAKARKALMNALPTWKPILTNGALSIGRQLPSYVLVADLIGLDGSDDQAFRSFLDDMLTEQLGTHARWNTLRGCHEDSDNNWGGWCGAARIAAAIYLGATADLDRAHRVYRGFLGDRGAYANFKGQGAKNGSLSAEARTWACDDSAQGYVPTNPTCGNRGGAFPSDASRSGSYATIDRQYQSETTAALVLQAELLFQNGFPGAWSAVADGLRRVAAFDYAWGAWNLGTVQYHWPWLINRRLGTRYPTVPAQFGRSLGYTDWLYGKSGGDNLLADPTPTPAPTASPKPTPTPTASPKPTPAPTASPKPTSAPTASPTPTPAPTANPDATPAPTATPDVTPAPTAEPTPRSRPGGPSGKQPHSRGKVKPSPGASATPAATEEPSPAATGEPSPGFTAGPEGIGTPAPREEPAPGGRPVAAASSSIARMLPLAATANASARGGTPRMVVGLALVREDALWGPLSVSVQVSTSTAVSGRYEVSWSRKGRANGTLVTLWEPRPRTPLPARAAANTSRWTLAPAILFVTDRGYLIVVVPLSAGGFGVSPATAR